MDRLKTFIKERFPIKLQTNKLSYISKTLLEKIIYQIDLGKKHFKNSILRDSKDLTSDNFPKGLAFSNIDEDIRNKIINSSYIGSSYSFSINDYKFTINSVYPYNTNTKYIHDSIFKMYTWLYAILQFASTKCSRSMIIYWYLTDNLKELPKNNHEHIGPAHANTAFTKACPIDSNFIYIYRKEEWFKVFIHETFHSFGLDFSTMSENIANDAIFKIFPINCDLRFYEAYTEMWAEIIQIIFISLEKGYSLKDNEDILFSHIEDCLNDERMFSLFQKVKILDYYNIKYRELGKSYINSKYNESTNVLSYYVLKSIFMFSYNDFIEWCSIRNKGTVNFKKTNINIISLVKFIEERYDNRKYVKYIKNVEQWFSENKDEIYEFKTLRMSLHG